jgi:large subunit ribosomal protein L10
MREKGTVPEAKKKATAQLAEDLSKHEVVAVAGLHKVRSAQIMEIRKKLRGKVKIFVPKNTMVRKAAEMVESEHKNIVKFAESLSGPSLFLLSDINPFQLKIVLDRNKVRVPAKGGDIATSDILVSAGNTGLPPGPIISEFSEAKIPTKIEGGSIYISKDTVVVRQGDEISTRVASVLSKLGMKPMEAGLSLVSAYDHGTVLDAEGLRFDLSEYARDFSHAARDALYLAVEANYVSVESAPMILAKAQRQALRLSLESEYPAVSATPDILRAAFLEMKALSEQLSARNKDAAPSSYEAPPAVVEALKLEVTPAPVKPPPMKAEKPIAVPAERRVGVAPPTVEAAKPAPVEELLKPEEPEAVEAPKREAPIKAKKKPAPKAAPERKRAAKRPQKAPAKKRAAVKKRRASKEKAKRGKTKSS